MNPLLLKIAKFMSQRPKDTTIRLFHILSGLIIIGLLWIAQDRSIIDIPFIGVQSPDIEKNIEYGLLILWLLPLLKGVLPFCLMKHKTLRIAQAVLGLLLIIIGGPVMDPIVTTVSAPSEKPANEFQIDFGTRQETSSHPGIFLIFLGIFWMLVWATWKGTTEKCLRYKEVVKKIRV